ncbi:MAG: hypothetical protein WC003_16635 [Terrimicrobiaceae bacterium]|nr:hypothetical protein [Terrimicrobiaceae bacterium]
MKPIPIVSRFLAARQRTPSPEVPGGPLANSDAAPRFSPRLQMLSLINSTKFRSVLSARNPMEVQPSMETKRSSHNHTSRYSKAASRAVASAMVTGLLFASGCAYTDLSARNGCERIKPDQDGRQKLIGQISTPAGLSTSQGGLSTGKHAESQANGVSGGLIFPLSFQVPVSIGEQQLSMGLGLPIGQEYAIPNPTLLRAGEVKPVGFVGAGAAFRVLVAELHTGPHTFTFGEVFLNVGVPVSSGMEGKPSPTGRRVEQKADRVVGADYVTVTASPGTPAPVKVPRDSSVAVPGAGCWVRINAIPDPAGASTRVRFEVAMPQPGQPVAVEADWPASAWTAKTEPLTTGSLTVLPLPDSASGDRRYLVLSLDRLNGDGPDSAEVRLQQISIHQTRP